MSDSVFDLGDRVRLSATFTDDNGDDSDPTEVTFKHRAGFGVVTTETYNGGVGNVTRDAVGRYHLDADLDAAGRWHWRAGGTDTPAAAGERSFTVRGSQLE